MMPDPWGDRGSAARRSRRLGGCGKRRRRGGRRRRRGCIRQACTDFHWCGLSPQHQDQVAALGGVQAKVVVLGLHRPDSPRPPHPRGCWQPSVSRPSRSTNCAPAASIRSNAKSGSISIVPAAAGAAKVPTSITNSARLSTPHAEWSAASGLCATTEKGFARGIEAGSDLAPPSSRAWHGRVLRL